MRHPLRILIVDADAPLFGLLAEWLRASGWELEQTSSADIDGHERHDLILIDVPFPRRGGADAVRRVARAQPGIPIAVLSSSFFAGVEPTGAVARSLGVAAVLPKPLKREALLDAVRRVLSLPQ